MCLKDAVQISQEKTLEIELFLGYKFPAFILVEGQRHPKIKKELNVLVPLFYVISTMLITIFDVKQGEKVAKCLKLGATFYLPIMSL